MKNKNSGIALILVVGILGVLIVIAMGFSTFTQLELKATENYANLIKAEFIAEAGIAQAIQELKYGSQGARNDPYDTVLENWYYRGDGSASGYKISLEDATNPSFDNLNGLSGDGISGSYAGGYYKLKILDSASQIYINDTNTTKLQTMLAQLPINDTGTLLGTTLAGNIITTRQGLPDGKFSSKEEIKLADGISQGIYDYIKNFITLYGDADTGIGHTQQVFININTAPKEVLRAVLLPIFNNGTLIDNLISHRNSNPFNGTGSNSAPNLADATSNFSSSRQEFHRFLEYQRTPAQGVIGSDADLDNIVKYTDPNRYNPSDSNTFTPTTYFFFDSGGYYEIECIGTYQGVSKRIKKDISIYKKIYKTTKQDFESTDEASILPTFARVSVQDNVPVNIDQCYVGANYDSTQANFIPGAIKIGFWDDFSDIPYSVTNWRTVIGSVNLDGSKLTTLPVGITNNFPTITLGDTNDPNNPWGFSDFSVIMRIEDEQNQTKLASRDRLPWPTVPLGWPSPPAFSEPNPNNHHVDSAHIYQKFMNAGQLLFRRNPNYANPSIGHEKEGSVYISNQQIANPLSGEGLESGIKESGWIDVTVPVTILTPTGREWHYFDPKGETNPIDPAKLGNKFMILCGAWNNNISCPYQPNKTIKLSIRTTQVSPTPIYQITSRAYYGAGQSSFASINLWDNLPPVGVIALFGSENLSDMDNVRVIPKQGVFTSGRIYCPPEPIGPSQPHEWGTIFAGVTLPSGAESNKETVTISYNYLEDPNWIPGPNDVPKEEAFPAWAGALGVSNTSLRYRLYLQNIRSGATDMVFSQTPVVEDITVTYLPKTEILSQSKN